MWSTWLPLLLLSIVAATTVAGPARTTTLAVPASSSPSMSVIILSWTGEWYRRPPDRLHHCGHLRCTYTWNLSTIDSASALLVHAPDLHNASIATRLIQDAKQRPLYYVNDEVPHWWTGDSYFQHYDIISTYDTLCDAPRPYVLSHNTLRFVRGIGVEQSDKLRRDPLTLHSEVEKKRDSGMLRGLAPIAWFVSNCGSGRSYMVAELMRHIPVDIYSSNHCLGSNLSTNGRSDVEDVRLLRSSYLFYLSLENNNCKDYVTEKLSRPLLANVLPVVDGPDDYSPFLPHSRAAVRVDDFDTPAALARYLRYLTINVTAYLEHMDMRNLSRPFVMYNERAYSGRCTMCHNAYHAKLQIAANGVYRRVPTPYRYSREQLCTTGKWDAYNTPDTRIVTTSQSGQYRGPRVDSRTWWNNVSVDIRAHRQQQLSDTREHTLRQQRGDNDIQPQQQSVIDNVQLSSPSATVCSSGIASELDDSLLRWRLTSVTAVSAMLSVALLGSAFQLHTWRNKQSKYGDRCKLQADELFKSLVRLWLLCATSVVIVVAALVIFRSYLPTTIHTHLLSVTTPS